MTGNSFSHARRRKMTPQRVLRIYLLNNGRCHVCQLKLPSATDYEIDHITALCNGGSDEDDNLAPICMDCHEKKTPDDVAVAGHGRRAAAKHFVPARFHKKQWQWGR
jgi:5-methylcytosine-specific restriction endonuclease McrA